MKIELYKELYSNLVSLALVAGIDEVRLQKYFVPEGDVTSKCILFRLCSSLQNSGMMSNSIKFNDKDVTNRNIIKKVLLDFNTMEAAAKYLPEGCESIYKAMIEAGIKDNGIKEKRKSNWEKYCRGLYDGLKFLVTDNGEKIINELVKASCLTENELKKISEISNQIHGLGFALTCDWLKECGCTWLAKPDVHINEVIKYMKQNDKLKDEEIIMMMFSWAKTIESNNVDKNATAYKIDKIIWLLCTGEFYLDNIRIGREAIYRKIDILRQQ